MHILLVSDTHGELDNVEKLAEKAREHEPDLIIHLGDDIPDAEPLAKAGFKVLRVPGVYEEAYKDPMVPHRLLLDLEGWLVLAVHAPKRHENDAPWDPDPREVAARRAVDIILHGHTHIPRAEEEDGVIWINPGHLKKQDKKGYPATYAVLDVSKEKVHVRILELATGNVLLEKAFERKRQ